MHLKALKLHGFKSFADPSVLRFEPGVTAIVGPNGCGKSNVADSIRWVLGEQSAKALRGGKMQDVIFEGADTRKPAQLCEVSLTLTDCEKQLGSEFHEIEIMRRVHRDGQSEYFFNGQPCRLKDIHKLFMDTGIGRTSYSVMAQGQIDQILSSKPEERRAVFEEAAGITKYKSQRKEALQKLGLTEQNLTRVADVIGEISRQIGSLRRQASKALRYKKLSYRLRHLALAHAGHQFTTHRGTIDELDTQIIRLRAIADARRIELQQRQAELEERRAERSRLNQRVQDAQQAVYDLRSQREAAENAANMAELKRTGLEERLAASQAQLGELEMQIRELAEQVDSGAQDKQLQLSLLGSSDAEFQSQNRELTVLEGEMTKLDQELAQGKFQLLQVESTVARLRTDTTSLEVDQKTSLQRHESLALDLEGVRQQQSAAAQVVAEMEARLEEVMVEKSRAASGLAEAQQTVAETTHQFREAQRVLTEVDRSLAQKSARLKLLQQLHEKWEGFGEGAKALLQGRFAHVLGEAKPRPLTDGLLVKPEAARAIEALLGASAESIGVADLATAQRILAELESGQIGSVHLQVPVALPQPGQISDLAYNAPAVGQVADLAPGASGSQLSALDSQPAGSAALPPFLHPATVGLDGFDSDHPAVALLAACYITDDLQAFLDHWRATPDFAFLAVASRRGDLVDRRGVIFGGYHKKPANSILQREIDLRETARLVGDEQVRHDAQRAVIDALNVRLAEAESAIEERRSDVLAATQSQAQVQAEQRNAQRAVEEVTARAERMERELVSVDQQRAEVHARWERAQTGLVEAEQKIAAQRARIDELEARLTAIRTERDTKRDALSTARLDLADRRQKVEVIDRGLTEMQRRRQQLEALLTQRHQEVEVWGEQIGELETQAAAQRARAAELVETFSVAQAQVEAARQALLTLERGISGVEGGQLGLRDEADRAATDYNRCEVRLAETRARLQFLTDEVSHEFQTDVTTLDWKALLWRAEDDPPDLKQLDLDDDEDEAGAEAGEQKTEVRGQKSEVSAAAAETPPVVGQIADLAPGEAPPEGAGASPESQVTDLAHKDPAADAAPTAPKRRRRKKEPRGEPTEADLAALDQTNWQTVKSELEGLRSRIGAMGAVNLVAIEEYAALKERYDFLKAQSDDLTNSKQQLVQAIDEINATSMQQFSITFEQIKKNFVYTFQTLFGGGVANLELVQTDDILESGIEITAQPPGTKLKGITLLSGGQKTLTAVALLFALYMVKPSPFCLLDELDAPLDESNIGRFTNLLKKFVHESQFIIITHNKRTIAAADAIYGVTMEERGVSKTVSMKFNQQEAATDAAEAASQTQTVADAVRGARAPVVSA